MYICIYVYMYICIYVYMYICVCIYICIYNICTYACMHAYMYICIMYICIYVFQGGGCRVRQVSLVPLREGKKVTGTVTVGEQFFFGEQLKKKANTRSLAHARTFANTRMHACAHVRARKDYASLRSPTRMHACLLAPHSLTDSLTCMHACLLACMHMSGWVSVLSVLHIH